MRTTKWAVLAVVFALSSAGLWSCKKERTQPPAQGPNAEAPEAQQTPSEEHIEQMREHCPMAMQGVRVEVSNIQGGIAMTFTTQEGDADNLRERVEHLAEMYEKRHERQGMMWHDMGGDMGHRGGHEAQRGMMPQVDTNVVEVENGARLELMPRDEANLDALREHVRMHQQRMQAGACWMLQEESEQY